eukprot:TRINITY_DN22308_c0_g1_i1.p1 TRINITY_DN22308_c0_g1~~TRINITY_DN22308_c0_g1_i1.p1  ORF type:complete len:706 (-),score=99.86 TRINITY_DN22308_c0_g1_i1:26-2143(-)
MAPKAITFGLIAATSNRYGGGPYMVLASVPLFPCSPQGRVVLDNLDMIPTVLHTNSTVNVHVSGYVAMDEVAIDAGKLRVTGTASVCTRSLDCMPLWTEEHDFCGLFSGDRIDCLRLRNGEAFTLDMQRRLPRDVFRGTFSVTAQIGYADDTDLACYMIREIQVFASSFMSQLNDYFDAIISFVIGGCAAASVGGLMPIVSCGMVPRLTGYLLVGALVGPYCCDLVTHTHISLIGEIVNKFAVAFIAGAAGAEIFLPDLRSFIVPMFVQVIFLALGAMVVVTVGIMFLISSGLGTVPAVSEQTSVAARISVSLLTSCLMATGSPASVISLIAELGCHDRKASKLTLGITVLTEITCLVIFGVCSKIAQVAVEGTPFDASVLGFVAMELACSALLGSVVGQGLRCVLPRVVPDRDTDDDAMLKKGFSTREMDSFSQVGSQRSNQSSTSSYSNGGTSSLDGQKRSNEQKGKLICTAIRGAVILLILAGAFWLAGTIATWTKGYLRLEPILVCTVAACVAGHDEQRRPYLVEGLSFWTQSVVLPYFTLAGASLQIPSLIDEFSVIMYISLLRVVGIAVGCIAAGHVITAIWPGLRLTRTAVWLTFMTLLAQAGVTLGLVLEVKSNFPGWGDRLGTLLIGIVLVNQITGPILCRIGFFLMFAAEDEAQDEDGLSDASSSDKDSASMLPPVVYSRAPRPYQRGVYASLPT